MPHIPILVLVAIVFALVVAAAANNVHLGLAALLGGILFGLLRGLGPVETMRIAFVEALDPDTILLLVLITSIMVFSAAMKNSGALTAFTRAVAFVAPSPRASLTLTPLLIGTLPMPGGAILSAPLVDALDPERRQGPDGLSAVNYWFRHVLELCWPLYPAFILTCTLGGISAFRLSLLNLYVPVILVTLGQIFVIKGIGFRSAGSGRDRKSSLLDLGGFLPLAILLGAYLVLDPVARALAPGLGLDARGAALFVRYSPIFAGLVAASLYVGLRNGFGSFRGAFSPAVLKLAGVIAGIRVFSALLEAGGVGRTGAAELAALGIPAIAVAVILPFISGIATGVGFAYVGIAFPIVLSLFPAGGAFPPEAAIVLAGAFGFAGMMLSPLHVCLVLTAEHFHAGILPVLKRFILPLAIFLVVACAYVAVLARFLGG